MRAPVSRDSSRSRWTISSSASAGHPGNPSSLQQRPSCMTAPWVRRATSQCWARTMSRPSEYSIARRMSSGSCTPLPSSVKMRTPAATSSAYGASASPARPIVMQPAGSTSHRPACSPWARTNSTTPRESCGGSVFGMATTAVNPPRAAALLPVSIVSASSRPGSRRWTWRSTNPGATTQPPASSTWSACSSAPTASPIAATRPSSISTSARRSPSRSTTVPPRMSTLPVTPAPRRARRAPRPTARTAPPCARPRRW